MASNIASLLAAASVPAFKCPQGTKMHILNLGVLQGDDGWYVLGTTRRKDQELILHRLLRGGNTSSRSEPNPTNKRRDLLVLAGLIEHPDMGLILFETGCAEDLEIAWPAPLTDVFARTEYTVSVMSITPF